MDVSANRHHWYLILYSGPNKSCILKILKCPSLKYISYLLDESYSRVSNSYHNLIKKKGIFKYVNIYSHPKDYIIRK